jgi:lipopolysaccharide biosynthesis protein
MNYNGKVAVILWLYHHDLWEEFLSLLIPIKDKIVLYVGLCEDHNNEDIIQSIKKNLSDYNISLYANCGVDVRPFIHQLSLVNEKFFIKLHSKKSKWGRKKHVDWRSVLVHSLIGSKEIFENNIDLLEKNNNIGIICNKNLILSNREVNHTDKIKKICNILDIEYNKVLEKKFCGGNMFASKTALYKQYFTPLNTEIDHLLCLEKRKIKENTFGGTYSHSLERVFGYIIEANQMIIAESPLKTIKILNREAPNQEAFNLIINYNNSCYVIESLNIYGHVIKNTKHDMLIKWMHLDTAIDQNYTKVADGIYTKDIKNHKI